jgi:chemotaxis protein CheZ
MHDPKALSRRMTELQAQYPKGDPDMVADVVLAVLESMTGDISLRETALLYEVGALGEAVASARLEIAALKVDDITASYIPCATDELDAIVAHTAAATESILEACETLDALGATLVGENAQRLQEATVKIYESCSFQDITGQRITKVVATLKTIEATVARIVATFGTEGIERKAAATAASENDSLLNGPQLPASAMDQSDIDRLLASFD